MRAMGDCVEVVYTTLLRHLSATTHCMYLKIIVIYLMQRDRGQLFSEQHTTYNMFVVANFTSIGAFAYLFLTWLIAISQRRLVE